MIELNPEIDKFGNIIGLDIPEYNIIKETDAIGTVTVKQEAQYRQLEKEMRKSGCLM